MNVRRVLSIRAMRQFIEDTDNAVLILALVGLGLFLSLGFPLAVPQAQTGARCSNLPHPHGGNRQSLLALQGGQEIGIELEVLDAVRDGNIVTVNSGEAVVFRVRFTNNDIGPTNLYFTEGSVTVGDLGTLPQSQYGLIFEIVPETATTSLRDNVRTGLTLPASSLAGTPSVTYDLDELYLLRSGGSCFVDIRFSPERLTQIGVTAGEYRVQAYYRNSDRGVYIPPTPNGAAPTATPMFTNLNVWIGTASSDDLILSVQP